MTHALRVFLFLDNYIAYDDGLAYQRMLAEQVRNGASEAIVLLQHIPVYTLGRRPRYDHLIGRPDARDDGYADVRQTDRGGDVTYHGPGQLVVYPILNLRARRLGPAAYVRSLESIIIDAISEFGISGERVAGRPGVWVSGDKIAAIGVRLQGGVTTHGFALNLDTDLSRYDAIVPCGITDAGVTSMQGVLGGRAPEMHAVVEALVQGFAAAFEAQITTVNRDFQFETSKELVYARGG